MCLMYEYVQSHYMIDPDGDLVPKKKRSFEAMGLTITIHLNSI